MSGPLRAPFGFWKSPITAERAAAGAVRLGPIALDGGDAYWAEQRPAEGGRTVVVRRSSSGETADATPAGVNVRSRVHEYGGGAFTADRGILYYSSDADRLLYRLEPGRIPRPLTRPGPYRYADLCVDRARGRLLCVREDHGAEGGEPANTLVRLETDGTGETAVLVDGADFYSSPRLSPDGSRLAWIQWDHPSMPWTASELWVADVAEDGGLENLARIAGGLRESVFQPEWSPGGTLYFVSDRTGWWNLYRCREGREEPVAPMEAEFGLPQWVFGMATYGFESEERLICAFAREGSWRLASLDTRSLHLEVLDLPYTEISSVRARQGKAVFCAASPREAPAVVEADLERGTTTVMRRAASTDPVDPAYFSVPRFLDYAATDGATAHALFYPPANPDYQAPEGDRPPLLVRCHGGPTSSASSALSLAIQFWTSRGVAVLDVNYGGSTGYGRAYRERLDGRWGIVDVEDCIAGARWLVERGEVDPARMAISGGSAGGYTVLCALTFHDFFAAGASYYGVSDLEALARDTHKFESRYLDGLIGPFPGRRDLYEERSPLRHADRLSAPVVFFQGAEDAIVPPDQTERMVEALRRKGVPCGYFLFEGEQHGFRRAENLRRALEGELYFYGAVMLGTGLRF